jgi:hypothetical protein
MLVVLIVVIQLVFETQGLFAFKIIKFSLFSTKYNGVASIKCSTVKL